MSLVNSSNRELHEVCCLYCGEHIRDSIYKTADVCKDCTEERLEKEE